MENDQEPLINDFYFDGNEYAMTITDTATLKQFFQGDDVRSEVNRNLINQVEQSTSQQACWPRN